MKPIFAQHFDLGDSPNSLFNIHIFGQMKIFIGSNRGRCYQLSLDKFDKLGLMHEDIEQRQIIAIGVWPFSGEIANQFESSSKCNPIIWLHFRSSAIFLFKLNNNEEDGQIYFSPLRELKTNHYGFCQAFSDPANGRIFIPDHEDIISTFRVRYRNGGEVIVWLEEEFLNKKFGNQGQEGMFKGMLMGIEPVENEDNCVFLAFEDSTICIFNWRTKEIKDALKHPKHCEFLCWSILSEINTGQTLIAVSVVGQLYLLSYLKNDTNSREELLQAECVIRKCKDDISNNCTSVVLSFSKNISTNAGNQHSQYCQIGAGLKNGTILIYSLQCSSPTDSIHSGHSSPRWTHQLVAKCTNAHSKSIQCLRWIPLPNEESESAHSKSHSLVPTIILCSAGSDEKISFFEFPTLSSLSSDI